MSARSVKKDNLNQNFNNFNRLIKCLNIELVFMIEKIQCFGSIRNYIKQNQMLSMLAIDWLAKTR